jgi:hypothetical protein
MKSWLKALLISVVIIFASILYLPSLAKQGLNTLLPWAMKQAELEHVEFVIAHLSWRQLIIEKLQLFSPEQNASFSAQQIQLTFSPWQLLKGKLDQAQVKNAQLSLLPKPAVKAVGSSSAITSANTASVPATADDEASPIELVSLEQVFNQLPINQLLIEAFSLSHPQVSIHSRLELTNKQLKISSQINSDLISNELNHELVINQEGKIKSLLFTPSQPAPIFNLYAHWSEAEQMRLSLQQSADIQSWLELLKSEQKAHKLQAKVAIQAWQLELELPKHLDSIEQLIGQIHSQGLWQIKIDDFVILDQVNNQVLLEDADLSIELHSDMDHQREDQWRFNLSRFDLSAGINHLSQLDFDFNQSLDQALTLACRYQADSAPTSQCHWQGKLKQTLIAENFQHQTQLELEGHFSDDKAGKQFHSRQGLTLKSQQENPLWPRVKNNSHGDIIVQGQESQENWHWQLNIPHGINNQSQYLDKLTTNKNTGLKLSPIHWQLLPDWQLAGINGELISAKAFAIIIDQFKLADKDRAFILNQGKFSCNLDWLKLQYSPQLRSQQALSQLPLGCDWAIDNQASQIDKWPLPAINFTGQLNLTSLDLQQAKLDARMAIKGLAENLDLTLLAQHDFAATKGLQQGSAQLYLNNLKLDWKELGLEEMEKLSQVQLLAGTISAQGWFQWQQYQPDIFDDNQIAWRWQPDVMLRIDDLAGIYQELTTWEDIDIQLALRRPFYQDFRIDSQFSALSIHPGIEVKNILARSTSTIKQDFSQALIVIEEVHSDVLGGRINVPLIRFDSSEEINSFGIEVEGLEVEQLAALEANAGIKATGQLDGVLPIILLPEGPQVPAGTLYARSPGGIVQYRGQTAKSLKQSNQSMGLAMQVLDDFRYDTLQTDVTYQPDGELNLGLKFQGFNPDFFDGQATHFNLNLEYNLLDLLESLRISNDIVQKLENKYQ